MLEQKCENCFYWFKQSENEGQCRRYPPTVYQSYTTICGFPITEKEIWCGEFSDKAELLN